MRQNRSKLILSVIGIIMLFGGTYIGAKHLWRNRKTQQHTKVRNNPDLRHDGIDISHHQGKLDWKKLSKDTAIQFVYIKATEGTTWQDMHFKRNAQQARKYGMKVGAYHLLSLTSSPETQVENFCKMVGVNEVDLIPALDIEAKLMNHKYKDRLKDYALRVSRLMTDKFGRSPVIYTSKGVYDQYFCEDFSKHYLWISAYTKRCPQLKGEAHADIWQYTENGSIEHCDKILDLNCFVNGMTLDKLELIKP